MAPTMSPSRPRLNVMPPRKMPARQARGSRAVAMAGKDEGEKILGMPASWFLKDSVKDGVGSELSTKGDGGYLDQFTKELEQYQKTYTKMLKAAGAEYTVNYQQELLDGKSRDKKNKPYKSKDVQAKFMK